jgi:hypothetical protein
MVQHLHQSLVHNLIPVNGHKVKGIATVSLYFVTKVVYEKLTDLRASSRAAIVFPVPGGP